MRIKDLIKALLITGGLFCFSLSFIACTKKAEDHSKDIIVQVSGHLLTAQDFATILSERIGDYSSLTARDTDTIDQAKESIIQDFVVKSVTKDWAQKNDIFVRKEALDAAVANIKAQYPDDIAFRQALAESGQTYDDWARKLQENLLEKLVLEKIRESVEKPTEKEILAYYKKNEDEFKRPQQVKLSQVVLETEEQAQKIYKKLRQGKKIKSLAKRFSVAPEAENGGDLGWIDRGTHEMFDTAFRLGVGGRSRVIKSPFGYHIFQVTGRRSAKKLRLKTVRDRIVNTLTAQREQEAYSKWLEAEILAAKVYKNEALIRDIKVFTRSKE